MGAIKKIMVAVDLSEYSLACIRKAGEIAQALGAELLLVNVLNQRDVYCVERALEYYEAFTIDKWITDNKADRQRQLTALLEQSGYGQLPAKSIVRIGVPYQELLYVIEEEHPDMLVMATKGRSNLADTIIGSCAQKMYRRSPIPVFSLRASQDE